jgi:hypothetical protein
MYNESYFLKQMERVQHFFRKWFLRETKKEIILPVSVATAKHRLQLAFASPVTISKGFFYATQKYIGQVNDKNEIDVRFSIRGRSNMHYTMHGQLLPDPKGSRILMTVKDKSSILLILAIILLMFLITKTKVQTAIVTTLVFLPVLIIALIWHRNSAANCIAELISNIISNQL